MRNTSWKVSAAIFVFCIGASIASPAQTFTTLGSFDGTDGAIPLWMTLIQATDGNFYGTTDVGGTNNGGAVFKVTPEGTITALYSFCAQAKCADGAEPYGGLVQGTDGNLYGTTLAGGANGKGTVFEVTLGGTQSTLYSFCAQAGCTDGANPNDGLVQGTDGTFYGTTYYGGTNNAGTVFSVTTGGKESTLHSFCAQTGCADGAFPRAALIQATNGKLYGTTFQGGAVGVGSIFSITTAGKLTTLYSFCSQLNCSDGVGPAGDLLQASNGDFYGVTFSGGGRSSCGTIFKMTSAGALSTLTVFSCANGTAPDGKLVQGTDGNFYGTTFGGGTNSAGTAFEVTPAGSLTTLYNFCEQTNCTDGANTYGGLLQSTNGTFYGATYVGGADGLGSVFSVATGLSPFVKTLPTSGKVGTSVDILGTNLTGATSVTFNGTAATFTVVSSSEITTAVPTGAKTGTVQVSTPSGTLKSNVTFRVP